MTVKDRLKILDKKKSNKISLIIICIDRMQRFPLYVLEI